MKSCLHIRVGLDFWRGLSVLGWTKPANWSLTDKPMRIIRLLQHPTDKMEDKEDEENVFMLGTKKKKEKKMTNVGDVVAN